MAHASFILTRDCPSLSAEGEVVLGDHQDGLVLVEAFPATVVLGWFAQYFIDADEYGLVEFEVWSQDLDGTDHEQRTFQPYPFIETDRQQLPREQEFWSEVDFEVTGPVEFLLAFKADGVTVARRLIVIWQRPG